MPIGLDKAPQTLPKAAQSLWVDTFNGVFENCKDPKNICDERAARIAWDNVKGKYRKVKDKWISRKSEAYQDVLLTITKASLQPDGSVRWQAVASDTGKDRADERTSIELFQDWIDRVTYGQTVSYLPDPKMPFLGISHYPALDGYGEAGVTYRMYIDGNTFKADGIFKSDNPVGQKLLDEVKAELALIKKGGQLEKPIRISAGWWDIQHYHVESNYLFTRQTLMDKCPICTKGQTTDKIYRAGQIDHLTGTRVPMNVRTSLELKSMAKKITRREDAESIIGPDLAEEMEQRARMVGKSDAEDGDSELHPAMVTRATKIGSFIHNKRKEKKMSVTELAAKTPVTDSTISAIEAGEHLPPEKLLRAVGKAIDVSLDDLMAMLPAEAETTKGGDMLPGEHMRQMRRRKKVKRAEVAKQLGLEDRELELLETDEDEMDIEIISKMADVLKATDEEKEELLARFGEKRRKEPPMKEKAAMKTVDDEKFPAGDFLVVEDPEKPTTWHLQVRRHGKVDRGLMGGAWAALHKGFRGNKYEGPDKTGAIQRLKKLYKQEDAPLPTEKMDYDDYGEEAMAMPMPPLGGATSIKEAEGYIEAQEKMDKMYSYWDMLQVAFHNIEMAPKEEIPDKIKATSNLFTEMAGKIDTLKAGLSDAFLIQSAAAYEDYEDAEDIEYLEEDEVNIMTTAEQTEHPADQLKAAVDTALENKTLTGADRETVVQEAFNEYAEGVQAQLQAVDPASQADQIADAIKGALADVLTPLAEQVGLLTAKMGNAEIPQPQGVTQLHEVYVPQQKSMMAPPTTPQPVQPTPGMPISPITGKPSRLRDMVEKSVKGYR